MTQQKFFCWVGWILVAAVAVFTLSPIEFRPMTGAPPDMERFAAFGVIGAAFSLGYTGNRLRIVLLVLVIAGFLEAAQYLVPSRHGSLHDWAIKATGALCGIILVMAFVQTKRTFASIQNEVR